MESKPLPRPQVSRTAAKQATRALVIRTASRAMRRDGIAATGVAAVMAKAGLTHGGFYAHFASKDALAAAAIDAAFAESSRRIARRVEGLAPAAALAAWIELYVTTSHRDDRSRGCALTALGSEASRGGDAMPAALARGMAQLTDRLADWLAAIDDPAPAATAGAMLAEAVGAITLARVLGATAASDALLTATRASLRRRAGIPA